MHILQECAHHQDYGGEHHEEERDDGHDPGAQTQCWILKQVPPPLLGPAYAGVWEYEHIVLLPLRGLLHHVLPTIVGLLAAGFHEQLTDPPVGELLAECNRAGLM